MEDRRSEGRWPVFPFWGRGDCQRPWFCALLSVTCYLVVLERRDSAEREDSRDLGPEKSAQPHCHTIPGPPHSHCSFQLAELIHTPPCLMTLISTKEEPKQEAPKEEKAHPPWVPPLQHNFLKNWQRNIALRKKQQDALSGEQSGEDACLALALRLCCCVFSPPSPTEPGFRLVAFVLSTPKCFLYLAGHEISPVTGADQFRELRPLLVWIWWWDCILGSL